MVRVVTPRPWPEGQVPTAEQFRDWFLACAPEEQLVLAQVILDDSVKAAMCAATDHEARLESQARTLRELAGADS